MKNEVRNAKFAVENKEVKMKNVLYIIQQQHENILFAFSLRRLLR